MTAPADLQAGPELDRLIVGRVMGDCVHDLRRYKKNNRDPDDDYTHWECRRCHKKYSGLLYSGGNYPHPKYSTDPAAALAVVDRMLDLGYSWGSHGGPTKSNPRQFFVSFTSWNVGPYTDSIRTNNYAVADTFPLATCRAALAALAAVGEGASGE